MRGKLLFTSKGLETITGPKLIKDKLKTMVSKLSDKRLMLVLPDFYFDYKEAILNACLDMGFTKENVFFNDNSLEKADVIYVTGGNTFKILDFMRKNNLCSYIQKQVRENGAIYVGASAGAVIASDDIEIALDFDMNSGGMTIFTGLKLFEGTIIPHYTKEQKDRYVAESNQKWISKYKEVYSVSNEEALVFEVCDWE